MSSSAASAKQNLATACQKAQQIKFCNILNDATCKFPLTYLTRGEKQDAVTWKSPTACQKNRAVLSLELPDILLRDKLHVGVPSTCRRTESFNSKFSSCRFLKIINQGARIF